MAEQKVNRRKFVKGLALGGVAIAAGGYAWSRFNRPHLDYPEAWADTVAQAVGEPGAMPNIILINADDLGYGDLGCYGGRSIKTPVIDSLAESGVRFTDFHSCDAVCSPSRAGMLTGRYPNRMMLDVPLQSQSTPLKKRVLIQLGYGARYLGAMDIASEQGSFGLNPLEMTIPEALKARGYSTAMVGKWHLGDYASSPEFNPTNHGFDQYFGVPYSNDMEPFPLYRGTEELESNIEDQTKLTGLYTEEAVRFIEASREKPFFLYFAHTFPHRPLFASERFLNKSEAGVFGDAVEEIDWSVSRLLETLEKNGLSENTLIMFTSDNGPWYQGSPGGHRGRKGQTFEGGHRVPFIARWPQQIVPGGVCDSAAMNIDLFPTCLSIAGLETPKDRVIDGRNIMPLLADPATQSPHEFLYFYHFGTLEGVRSGKWKYFRDVNHYTWPMPANKMLGNLSNHTTGPAPLLFNLELDPGESYNVINKYPEVAKRLEAQLTARETEMQENRLGVL